LDSGRGRRGLINGSSSNRSLWGGRTIFLNRIGSQCFAVGVGQFGVEGRDRAKGNSPKRDKPWTLCQEGLPSALERVGQAARQDRKTRFTALLHHIYDVGRLRRAYMAIEHDAAAGIDGETWRHYGENLKGNLEDLSARLGRGAYRAKPVRRASATRRRVMMLSGAKSWLKKVRCSILHFGISPSRGSITWVIWTRSRMKMSR
jgi:hypothetical protein